MQRPARAVKMSFLLLAFCLGLPSCKRIVDQAIKAHQDGGASGQVAGRVADDDQALGEKLNGYIRDCLNRYS